MITEKDLTGQMEGVPLIVAMGALIRQYEQNGKCDIRVFQETRWADKYEGGFNWASTPEDDYWETFLCAGDFSVSTEEFARGFRFDKTDLKFEGAIKGWPLEIVLGIAYHQHRRKGYVSLPEIEQDPLFALPAVSPEAPGFWLKVINAPIEQKLNIFREGYKGPSMKPFEDHEDAETKFLRLLALIHSKREMKPITGEWIIDPTPRPRPQVAPRPTGSDEVTIARIAGEVYDKKRAAETSLSEQLKELGYFPEPVTVTVKTPKETKKVDKQHFLFPTVLKAITARVNLALVGPAGSGKTTMVHKVAETLGLAFYSKSVSAQTGVHEFFGYQDANGKFVRTLFREAYENGGVYLVDEFDAGNPNVLAALNQATANGSCAFPDKMVDKHKDFIVVMAGNTYGTGATSEYVGRNKIDAATLDRFAFIPIPYDEALEMALATNKEWCRTVQGYRKRAESKKVKCIISPRATFAGEKMLEAGIEEDFVLDSIIFKNLSEDERRLIQE